MQKEWGRGVGGFVVYEHLKGAVVRLLSSNTAILQCTLEGVQVVGVKCIRWKSVPLCY